MILFYLQLNLGHRRGSYYNPLDLLLQHDHIYMIFFFASRKILYVRRTKELIIKDFIFTVYDLKFVLLNFDMKSFYWALEMNRKVWLTEQDYEIYNSEKFNHIFLSLTNWISRIAEFKFQASIKKKFLLSEVFLLNI